jgi:hypothetical protein
MEGPNNQAGYMSQLHFHRLITKMQPSDEPWIGTDI